MSPTDPNKIVELNCYKSLESILYLDPHRKLKENIDKIAAIKEELQTTGRQPTDEEINMVAKYNEYMMKRADALMKDALKQNPSMRHLTSVE